MPPADSSRQQGRRRLVPGFLPRAWMYIAIAFAAGVLVFVLIWVKQRSDRDFYPADATTQGTSGRQFEPLPGPDMDGMGGRSEAEESRDVPGDSARLVETTPPPPPPAPAAAPQPPSGLPAASAAAADTAPVPVERPAPRYPRDALRRGESGEVLLRVEVGANGVPTTVDVVRGSGSRSLDRAAQAAVRQWRFQPALRDGQPVTGEVRVPIAFEARR